jgi:signal transduction histidine kinase
MIEETFHRVTSLVPAPTALLKRSGLICDVNPAARARFGLAPGAMLASVVADPPAKLAKDLERWARAEQPVAGRLTLRTSSGREVVVRTQSSVLVPGASDDDALIVLVMRPIAKVVSDGDGWSEALDGDGDGRAATRDMVTATTEHALLRRIADLEAAQQRKDDFLAMLGHELRNPLGAVQNALDVLRRSGAPADGEELACEIMRRQMRQATRLVDDLLDVSRISRGKVRLELRPVDVAAILAEAVRHQERDLTRRGLSLEVEPATAPLWVLGDAGRLQQVFTNVLHNAAKYTDPAGGVAVSARVEGAEVVVRVRDTGIGMTEAERRALFEPFAQGDGARARDPAGLGIGLGVVKSLVELHCGTVRAKSDGPGTGTEIEIRLPSSAPPAASSDVVPAPRREAGTRPLSILVVDDNHDLAAMLALLLEGEGHRVRLAHDGPAALAAWGEASSEVVLLDLGLPGMSGLEVAGRLLEQAGPSRPLLVAMTGYGQDEDRRRSMAAGFDHHLVKPVELEALQRVLRHAT